MGKDPQEPSGSSSTIDRGGITIVVKIIATEIVTDLGSVYEEGVLVVLTILGSHLGRMAPKRVVTMSYRGNPIGLVDHSNSNYLNRMEDGRETLAEEEEDGSGIMAVRVRDQIKSAMKLRCMVAITVKVTDLRDRK